MAFHTEFSGGRKDKNLYEILGVPPNASTATIEAAYRILAKSYCPDRAYADDWLRCEVTEIARALAVLRDPKSRRRYDRSLRSGKSKPSKLRRSGYSLALACSIGLALASPLLFDFSALSRLRMTESREAPARETAVAMVPARRKRETQLAALTGFDTPKSATTSKAEAGLKPLPNSPARLPAGSMRAPQNDIGVRAAASPGKLAYAGMQATQTARQYRAIASRTLRRRQFAAWRRWYAMQYNGY